MDDSSYPGPTAISSGETNDSYQEPDGCSMGGYDVLTPLYVSIDIALSILGVIGNAWVILSVIKFRFLRTYTNKFVVSLAASDLLVSISIPYYILFYFNVPWLCDKYPCLARYFTIEFSTIMSMTCMIGVAIDRYIAIVRPFSYRRLMATKWVNILIAGSWVYVTGLTLPLFYFNEWSPTIAECDLYYIASPVYVFGVVGLHVVLTLTISVHLYIRIFRVAWKQARAVASIELEPRAVKETRIARTMVVVLGACILGLVPYFVVVATRYSASANQEVISHVKRFVVCLYLGKSTVNPLIYAWKNPDFQCAFQKMICHCQCCSVSFLAKHEVPRSTNGHLSRECLPEMAQNEDNG